MSLIFSSFLKMFRTLLSLLFVFGFVQAIHSEVQCAVLEPPPPLIQNCSFLEISFNDTNFMNTNFINVDFGTLATETLEFNNVIFTNCVMQNVRFTAKTILMSDVMFDNATLEDVSFNCPQGESDGGIIWTRGSFDDAELENVFFTLGSSRAFSTVLNHDSAISFVSTTFHRVRITTMTMSVYYASSEVSGSSFDSVASVKFADVQIVDGNISSLTIFAPEDWKKSTIAEGFGILFEGGSLAGSQFHQLSLVVDNSVGGYDASIGIAFVDVNMTQTNFFEAEIIMNGDVDGKDISQITKGVLFSNCEMRGASIRQSNFNVTSLTLNSQSSRTGGTYGIAFDSCDMRDFDFHGSRFHVGSTLLSNVLSVGVVCIMNTICYNLF